MFKMEASEFVREFLSFYEIKASITMYTRPCHRILQGALRILLHSHDRLIIIYFNFISHVPLIPTITSSFRLSS